MDTITMTVRKDGWVKGFVSGISFTALVCSEPSAYGINNGRVSKLFMSKNGMPVLSYDRQWEKEAEEKYHQSIFQRLLIGLESLPE